MNTQRLVDDTIVLVNCKTTKFAGYFSINVTVYCLRKAFVRCMMRHSVVHICYKSFTSFQVTSYNIECTKYKLFAKDIDKY